MYWLSVCSVIFWGWPRERTRELLSTPREAFSSGGVDLELAESSNPTVQV